mgnify:CR=1 FL=1|tara:strand:+ start:515 stop:943 length:429 start_codon:yes stop_codon:yes gene_type:complete
MEEKLLEFKINIRELSTSLSQKRLRYESGETDESFEKSHMTSDENGILKYNDEAQSRLNELYNHYWNEITDAMIYPCYTGEKFYEIFQSKKDKVYGLHEYEAIERVWDETSEEIYRLDPMRKMFRTKEEAEEYIKELTTNPK